ncbi:MAG TPA: glycosyltransferase family 4 protein [Candidatus Thermoplasmatota archaeon]|nr:glycosyltransferase family 4 protein [Candidatus Thermoplasmatota archaeon]
MRVTIVSPYDPRPAAGADPLGLRGGVEEALDRCARGLARHGHDVTLVTSAPQAGETVDADGVRVVRVRRHGSLFRAPIAALWRRVPEDADVVHVPATYPLVSDLVPLRESGRRAVVVDYHFDVHGTSLAMRAAAGLYEGTFGRAMRRATRIVCKSRDYAAHSPVLSRLPPERVDWVPNGVDVDDFPLHEGPREDILCVGRLVPYKGVDVLVRAMPRIHDLTGARLTVVGDGPEHARLRSLAAQLGAPVDFRGRVPGPFLPSLYGSHRLTVLPSVNSQEAFGIALLESMATGTPVVASDLPGVREVAALAGTTAPAGEPDALADAVAAAHENARAFGSPREIRARVEARYAWPSVVRQLERVYERAVEATLARPRKTARRARVPAGGPS